MNIQINRLDLSFGIRMLEFVDLLPPLKCWPPSHTVFELNELLPDPELVPTHGDSPPAVIHAQQAEEDDPLL